MNLDKEMNELLVAKYGTIDEDTAFKDGFRAAVELMQKEVDELKAENERLFLIKIDSAIDHPCYQLSKDLEAELTKMQEREKILVEATSRLTKYGRELAELLDEDYCEGPIANQFEQALLDSEEALQKLKELG